MEDQIDSALDRPSRLPEQQSLQRILGRISNTLERDDLVQRTTAQILKSLGADRVVLYYFYRRWQGQVICESLSSDQFSILGETGADECFNGEYAALYEAGRYRAIADIETEPIHECHRDFLKSIQVRANLAVPILNSKGLWGILVTHYCKAPHNWSSAEIETVRAGAQSLAAAPSIREN
jgi:GAF domain-containing protein